MKLKLWVAALVTAAACFSLTASAAPVNGLSVSDGDLEAGERFTVTVSAPASVNADAAAVRVEFDPDVFEVESWAPSVSGGLYNSGDGFFALSAANAARNIDLSGGLALSADMKVKKDAADGTYSFRLTLHDLTYVKDNGYDYETLWSPEVTEISVNVAAPAEAPASVDTAAVQTVTSPAGTAAAAAPADTADVSAGKANPLNPHTGVAIAVAVPAGLVGCALLARKIVKRRKRTKKYIDD